MNRLLSFLKENLFLIIWQIIVFYCVIFVLPIIYFIIVFPKIEWLVSMDINPFALGSSVVGIILISYYLTIKVCMFLGLDLLIERVKAFLNEYSEEWKKIKKELKNWKWRQKND